MSWSMHFLARSKAAAHKSVDEAPNYVPPVARAALKAMIDAHPELGENDALEVSTNGHIGTPDDASAWRQDNMHCAVSRRTIVG